MRNIKAAILSSIAARLVWSKKAHFIFFANIAIPEKIFRIFIKFGCLRNLTHLVEMSIIYKKTRRIAYTDNCIYLYDVKGKGK